MEDLLKIAKNAFPPVSGSEKLKGIKEEVEILWDNWGIPHVYAKSLTDVYFTQGYLHSRHRLWQMETFRRLISGELSELTGEATLLSDKYYRTLGLHRLAKKCTANLEKIKDSEEYYWINAYINGVNVGIKEAQKIPPIEFSILNIKPREWLIEDSFKIISMMEWGLSSWNFPLEVIREHLIIKLGLEKAKQFIPFFPETFVKESKGSNAWAVSPNKSKSGAVLLANDPHLALMNPAIWFLVHLNCPEMNVIGTSLAGLPMVVIGHNENIAWGLTNVTADTIDLFELELNPENQNQYKYNGEWIDFEVITEQISVQDKSEPIMHKVLISKFGPVVDYFDKNQRYYKFNLPGKYALRWSSFEPDLQKNITGFIYINKASNWQEFRDGIKHITINPQNFIYGDLNGNIGHQHGGRIPVRNYGDGATITPGIDEKCNWKSLSTFDQFFSRYNPKEGFVYTANFNEDKAPNGLLIAQDRIEPYRQIRLKKLMQSKDKFSIEDFKNFQLDRYTEEAAELLPIMLKHLKSTKKSDEYSNFISILEEWDYFLTKNSIAGTIFKIWHQETLELILASILGEELLKLFCGSRPFNLKRIIDSYQENLNELEDILLKSFKNTISFLIDKLSSDYKKWQWGNLHKLTLTHPFSLVNKEAKVLNAGPFKLGGDENTLNNGSYDRLSNYDVIVGPSYRQIHDLSDWDKSIGALPGGQSGLPFHKHYKDLIKLWVKGTYIPYLFSREAISDNLEGFFKLIPE
ncbi:MAG: penicillin acylase family protein [Candidatus Hermodarchaeota archaeon]